MANAPPSAALDMNIGASSPPEVPEPSEITSADCLGDHHDQQHLQRQLSVQMSPIVS